MKLNCKLLYLILFLCASLTAFCTEIKPKKELNNHKVIVLNADTIITAKVISYHTRLKLGNKEIEIKNNFLYDKTHDQNEFFNLKNYLGIEVRSKQSLIKQFSSFKDSFCNNASWKVFTVFKGDSIDNLEGYNYKYIAHNKTEYYILNGYFYGCNGSICNSGAIIVLKFENGMLLAGALFGIDKSTIKGNTVKPFIKNNLLFLTIEYENNGRKKQLVLSIDKEINILSSGGLIENGLYCIK